MIQNSLISGFLHSVKTFPDHIALEIGNERISYKDLFDQACRYAHTLDEHDTAPGNGFGCVFANRSKVAFLGVLAFLLRGNGYVPLNRTFPIERTKMMFERSECRTMIVDSESARQLDEVIQDAGYPLTILMPESDDVDTYRARYPEHTFLTIDPASEAEPYKAPDVSPDAIAYILFTSGSTGRPKGVMVSNTNVVSYMRYMADTLQVTDTDRFSQTFDFTFDLSVFDMFLAWECGACICCPSSRELLDPLAYIRNSRLTIWFSVPSYAILMKQMRILEKDAFPTLRLSLFCGEPLPVNIVQDWAPAAPNSMIANLYGPTELTISCTIFQWDPDNSAQHCFRGVVPIGFPHAGMEYLVVDETLNEVGPGLKGELLVTGPQMAPGYWKEPEKTRQAFIVPPGHGKTYYRTGDIVIQPAGDNPLVYVGRNDSQVKIMGYRVELGEIESVVREESGINEVAALGWPITETGAAGIELFMRHDSVDVPVLLKKLRKRLPYYMVPVKIHTVDHLPLNSNGKFDRVALQKMLEEKVK